MKKKVEPKVHFIMQDGRVLDSLEGITIPAGHPVYNVLKNAYLRIAAEKEAEIINGK